MKQISIFFFTTLWALSVTAQDVYVAGEIGKKAVVWKNGEVTNLTNGTNTAGAHSVFVSGNDVYVAGYESKGSKNVAKIWKNGTATNLTDGTNTAVAYSVFVSGNDVYVAGYESTGSKNVAKIWKNGTATNFTANGSANSVFVSGGDVYVAGRQRTDEPCVWKNGEATALEHNMFSYAFSVFVSGSDVYVAGINETNLSSQTARLWKNNIVIDLTPSFVNSAKEASARDVFVDGSDVYVAGYEDNRINDVSGTTYNVPMTAKVWKNGTATSLTDGTRDARAESVFVSGYDVYVVGYEKNSSSYSQTAKIWKNGVETALTDGTENASANSVFVAGNPSTISNLRLDNAQASSYYSITGQKLDREPESGIYIIKYDNGKVEKKLKIGN